MKRCSVRPYVGSQPYIYLAHSAKDKHAVYPMIEQLARDGYRVWYDDGTGSGGEIADAIARRIAECAVLLAVFSDNTVDSCHFKREVNFAVLKKKETLSVMLEEVFLTPGTELQMAAYPAIHKYKLDNNAFYQSLYSFEALAPCRGEPDHAVVVADEEAYKETLVDLYGVDDRCAPPLDDAVFFEAAEGEPVPKATLTKFTNHDIIDVTVPKMIVGRAISEKIKPIVDYSIETNSMVSRFHAVIVYKEREFYLIDCGAVNKTYLNGRELVLNREYLLHDGDILKLANEKFRFHRFEV